MTITLGIVAVLLVAALALVGYKLAVAHEALGVLLSSPAPTTTLPHATDENGEEYDVPERGLPAFDPTRNPISPRFSAVDCGVLMARAMGAYFGRLTECHQIDASPMGPIMTSRSHADAAADLFAKWAYAAKSLPENASEFRLATHQMFRDLAGAYSAGWECIEHEAADQSRYVLRVLAEGKTPSPAAELKLCALASPLFAAQHAGERTAPKIVRQACEAMNANGTGFVPRIKEEAASANAKKRTTKTKMVPAAA